MDNKIQTKPKQGKLRLEKTTIAVLNGPKPLHSFDTTQLPTGGGGGGSNLPTCFERR